MTTETDQKKLDAADLLVQVKAVETLVVEKFDEVKSNAEEIRKEIGVLGEARKDTLAKHEKLAEDYNELFDRLQVLEQKGVDLNMNQAANETLGQKFIDSDAFTALQKDGTRSAAMEVKAAIINATGSNQPLVAADRASGVYQTPNRVLRLRDLIPSSNTDSNMYEFTRESSFTNAAAGQGAGSSPETFENVSKPESAMTFSLVQEPIVTLAHFIPASKQVLEDANGLASHIDGRLLYGLKLKEETESLVGTGGGHQLNGLVTLATTWAPSMSPQSTNNLDRLRDAIRQAQVSEYAPDFMVLNPLDWFNIETMKVNAGTDDRYIVGDPTRALGTNLWGLPVIVSNSITAGTFLLGNAMAAEYKDREQSQILVSLEHSDNFTKNMVTVLAEERVALATYRTEAFITGSLV